jgi:hypothetical protein
MTRCYKKTFKDIRIIDVKDKEGSGYKVKGVKKYKFKQSHPGYKFSHLPELKHHTIPRISLQKKSMSNERPRVTFNQSNQRFA